MTERRIQLLLVLALSCLLALAFMFIDREAIRVDRGAGPEARRNPFRAAELFLARNELTARGITAWQELEHLDSLSTLLIARSDQILTDAQADRLVAWIEDGGHLIVGAAFRDDETADVLLDRYDVTTWRDDVSEDDKDKKMSERLREWNDKAARGELPGQTPPPAPIPEADITQLSVNGVERKVRVHFAPHVYLYHASFDEEENKPEAPAAPRPTAWAGSEAGTQIIQFEIGDGRLSILSDTQLWQNGDIDKLDHAWLLWWFSDGHATTGIFYGREMPSLPALLWRYAREALVALALFLVAWLWFRAARFGRIDPLPATERRALAEHLRACAEFQWRNGHGAHLLRALREAVMRQATRRHPGFARLSRAAQRSELARLTGESRADIAQILDSACPTDEHAFRTLVHALQRIRNST
jgi:hypothetical protein